ncbi:hypothetical protein EDB85DRAFT_1895244 [Lactarius pseudohatsudake]|nr:hypothetical protein EDB85DRAFT_1895244 [Lactarius pseudohatsudake]
MANTPTTREDMWGHSTYLDDEGLHVCVSQTRTRRRNRLRYEAAQRLRTEEHQREVQAGDTQNILLGGDALAHGEPVNLGLPEADIDNDDAVPGSGWRRALADEPYPMDIPLVGGGRSHARYLRFTLDAEGRPTVLGSEGAGRPAYSSRLYACPQPREQHTPNNDSLALYDSHHASRHDIDLALARLGDPGVCAEVLRYRGLACRKEQLLGQMRDLERRWTDWVGRARGVDRRLREANVPSRLAVFLPDPLPNLLTRVALNYEPNLDIRIMAHADADDGPLIIPLPHRPSQSHRNRYRLHQRTHSLHLRPNHLVTATPFALPCTVATGPRQRDPWARRVAPRACRTTQGIRQPRLPRAVAPQQLDPATRHHPIQTTTASTGADTRAISTEEVIRDERGKKGAYVTIT